MRGIETSLSVSFHRILEQEARSKGVNINAFPTDGQDRYVAADYVISIEHDLFCLIEYKSFEKSIKNESKKDKIFRICEILDKNAVAKSLHDKCHFIGFLDSTEQLSFNIYRNEVCNREILGEKCKLKTRKPDTSRRFSGLQIVFELIDEPTKRAISVDDFNSYISLIRDDDDDKKELQLAIIDPYDNKMILLNFTSINNVSNWLLSKLNETPRMKL